MFAVLSPLMTLITVTSSMAMTESISTLSLLVALSVLLAPSLQPLRNKIKAGKFNYIFLTLFSDLKSKLIVSHVNLYY